MRCRLVADFNSIRNEQERVGRGERVDIRDIEMFDDFTTQSSLPNLSISAEKIYLLSARWHVQE